MNNDNTIDKKKQYNFLDANDFLGFEKLKDHAMCPVIDGLFYQGDVSIAYGDSQTGKTFGMLDIAESIAYGLPSWQRQKIYSQGTPVLYLACENYKSVMYRLNALLTVRNHKLDRGKFTVFPMGYKNNKTTITPRDYEEIIKQWKEQSPNGVFCVVDTLSASRLIQKENDNDLTADVISAISEISKKNGIHTCFIDHTSKADKSVFRGASGKLDNLDTGLLFEKETSGNRKIVSTKIRDDRPLEPIYYAIKGIDIDVPYKLTDGSIISVKKNIGFCDFLDKDTPQTTDGVKAVAVEIFAKAFVYAEKNHLLIKDKLPYSVLYKYTKENTDRADNYWTPSKERSGFSQIKSDVIFDEKNRVFSVVSGSQIEFKITEIRVKDTFSDVLIDN